MTTDTFLTVCSAASANTEALAPYGSHLLTSCSRKKRKVLQHQKVNRLWAILSVNSTGYCPSEQLLPKGYIERRRNGKVRRKWKITLCSVFLVNSDSGLKPKQNQNRTTNKQNPPKQRHNQAPHERSGCSGRRAVPTPRSCCRIRSSTPRQHSPAHRATTGMSGQPPAMKKTSERMELNSIFDTACSPAYVTEVRP